MRFGTAAVRGFADRPFTLLGLVLLAAGMRTAFEYGFTAALEEDAAARRAPQVTVDRRSDDPPRVRPLPLVDSKGREQASAPLDPLVVAGAVGGLVMCLGVAGALVVLRRTPDDAAEG